MAVEYVTEEEVVALHDAALARYGGMPGTRDLAALQSCVAQPGTEVFGHERFPSISDKTAAYCFFIARNHPFFDGNKRTALLTSLHFLMKNGMTPFFDHDETYALIIGVADGTVDIEQLSSFFRRAIRGRGMA